MAEKLFDFAEGYKPKSVFPDSVFDDNYVSGLFFYVEQTTGSVRLAFADSHSLELDSVEETDPVTWTAMRFIKEQRRFQPQQVKTDRKRVTEYVVTINMPPFPMTRTRELFESDCPVPVIRAVLDCDYCSRSAIVYLPSQPFDTPKPPTGTQLVAGGVDASQSLIGKTTGFSAPVQGELFGAKGALKVGMGAAAHAAAWIEPADCVDCAGAIFCPDNAILGGVAFAAVDEQLGTLSNGVESLDTKTLITTTLAAGMIILDMIEVNGQIVGVFADDADIGAVGATTGGVFIYNPNTGSFSIATDAVGAALATPLGGIAYEDGLYIAVGKAGAIFKSSDVDNTEWTVVTPGTPTTDHLRKVALSRDVAYIAGDDGLGAASAFTLVATVLTDITTSVVGSSVTAPTIMYDVHNAGEQHLVFTGDNGFFSENPLVHATGSSWKQQTLTVAGTAGTIRAIGGDKFRLLVGMDTDLLERSILTVDAKPEYWIDMTWNKLNNNNDADKIIGNITAIAAQYKFFMANFAIIASDTGETLLIKPCAGSC